MALSNSTLQFIQDPQVFNQSRCEFRIPDGMYITNLVLANVGFANKSVTDSTGLYHNSVNGILSCINKLSIYSGGTLIDEIQELDSWASIKHLMTSNQGSEDLNRFDLLNGMNVALSGSDANLTTQATNKDYTNAFAMQTDARTGVFPRLNNLVQVANVDDDGRSGMLVLGNYLQFLASVQVLPAIENLRIVIEWASKEQNRLLLDPNAPAAPASSALTVIRPQLVYTQILNMKVEQSMKIPFTSTFVERFIVPAVAEGVSKYTSFRSGAFRQRYLQNLILYNQTDSANGWLLKEGRSVAQLEEVIQLIWNGRKYLPDQGINTPAMKMRYFTETMGSLNVSLASAMPALEDVRLDRFNLFDEQASKLVSSFSVTAVPFNDVCDRMDIEITRTGGLAGDQQNAYTLLAFGQVSRLLTIVNGQVRLSY
jgi:hypothetical protein